MAHSFGDLCRELDSTALLNWRLKARSFSQPAASVQADFSLAQHILGQEL